MPMNSTAMGNHKCGSVRIARERDCLEFAMVAMAYRLASTSLTCTDRPSCCDRVAASEIRMAAMASRPLSEGGWPCLTLSTKS
jgi:hypothetical protein